MGRCRACQFVRPREPDLAAESTGWDCPNCKRSLDRLGRPYAERVRRADQVVFRDHRRRDVVKLVALMTGSLLVGLLGMLGGTALVTVLAVIPGWETFGLFALITFLLLMIGLSVGGSLGTVAGLVYMGRMREIAVGPLRLVIEGTPVDFSAIARLEGMGDDFAVVLEDGRRFDIGWMVGLEEELRPALERFRAERIEGTADQQADVARDRARLAQMAAKRTSQ